MSDIEQRQRVFGLNRGTRPLLDYRAICFAFAAFGVEIFDRLVIEQAVDRASDSSGVELVHFLAEFVAPVSYFLRKDDVDDDHEECRRDQFPAEFEVKYGRDAN